MLKPSIATNHDPRGHRTVPNFRSRKRHRSHFVGPFTITFLLLIVTLTLSNAAILPSVPLPIPLALASITHPVAVPPPSGHHHGTNSFQASASTVSTKAVPPPMNANDVIGYIVVPYPSGVPGMNSNQRADLQSSIFSMLSPFGSLGSLGRNYRTLRSAYTPPLATASSSLSPLMYNPFTAMTPNPLAAYSAAAYQGYPSLYGYNTRFPFFGLFG